MNSKGWIAGIITVFTVIVAFFQFNWLQVLGTAEGSQVDQGIGHQLHPIVALLEAFKSKQQPLEFVLPRKGPLDAQA
jgi:hypothetical protein